MSSGSESGYPSKKNVLSTTVYESGPPVPVGQPEVLSTTQTEEWTTKKKTDTLVTKQIETRVKREIVVTEDGEIIEDSGPTVTTDTTENTRTEENENVEHKTSGLGEPGPGWVLVPGSKVISETKKVKSTNHETREEKKDTEVTEEIGGITRQEIDRALKQRETAALLARADSCSTDSPVNNTVLQSSQTHQIVDTEEVDETADIRAGAVVNRKKTTTNNREEFYDEQKPDGLDPAICRPTLGNEPIITSPNSTAPRKPKRKHQYQSSVRIESVPSSPFQEPDVTSPTSTSSRQPKNSYSTKFEFEPTSILRNPIITSPTSTGPRKPKPSHQSPFIESIPSSTLLRDQNRHLSGGSSAIRHPSNSPEGERTEVGDTREADTGTPNSTNTSQWVESHFGSQDFIDSGIVSDQLTTRSNSGLNSSTPKPSANTANEHIIPINVTDTDYIRRVHYSKRQQLPEERNPSKSQTPSPSSEPEMLRFAVNGNGEQRRQSSSSSSSLPKKQYYLGEDPGVGQRFTGMSHDTPTRQSPKHVSSAAYNTNSLSRPMKSQIDIQPTRFSTLGRDVHIGPSSTLNGQKRITHAYHNSQPQHGTNGHYNKRDYYPTKSATMGRNGSGHYSTQIDTDSPPSVTDIIHSLRSKEYLDKESAAVSIRDDDSVFDHRHQQTLFRPYIPSSKRPANKQHVIKISIKSGDESDCSSPIHSPRGNSRTSNHHPSYEYQHYPASRLSSGDYENSHNDSIVKNAISSLLKNRVNSNGSSHGGSPISSAYSSLQRNPHGYTNGSSTLKSKTYLHASSPNVNRIEVEPPPMARPHQSRYTMFNGNRSKSIGNLSKNNEHYRESQYNTDYSERSHSPDYQYNPYSQNGVTRMSINDDNKSSRHQFMQKLLDNNRNSHHNNYREKTPTNIRTSQRHAPVQPRWSNSSRESARAYSPSSGSPPSSPSYTNRIKLPSPIPPSRSSSSPPRSPRSPIPPLTRPYSPSQYYSQQDRTNRSHHHGPPDYDISSRYRSTRSTSTPHHYQTRSPSPPTYRRRPPSPILPKPSSIGDDVASNASGQSRSTNAGSRESDESLINGQIKSTSKKKVTTTTMTKREVDSPVSDFYYDAITNGSLPRDKLGKSVIRVRDYNNR